MVLRTKCNNYEVDKKIESKECKTEKSTKSIGGHRCKGFRLFKFDKNGNPHCPINNEEICFNKLPTQMNIDEARSKAKYDF